MLQLRNIPYCDNSRDYFLKIQPLSGAVWLDSANSNRGRFDIISAMPIASFTYSGEQLRIDRHSQSYRGEAGTIVTSDPVSFLYQQLSRLSDDDSIVDENLPFVGGLIGNFDYEAGPIHSNLVDQRIENQEQNNAHSINRNKDQECIYLGLYQWALIVDHQLQSSTLVALPEMAQKLLDDIEHRLIQSELEPLSLEKPSQITQHLQAEKFELTSHFVADISYQQYIQNIAKILNYINRGDCYQVNYAQRFSAKYNGNLLLAYLQLRQQQAPFSAYIETPTRTILSFSPERFLKIVDDRIETSPIKGTAPRSQDVEEDAANAEELKHSSKNRAENLMIVDLLRNDLSRHSQPFSVKVEQLFELESFEYVHHLVSTISSRMAADSNPMEILRDAFPGGSITGAPKRRAMQIIDELEPQPRQSYCGSIGYISYCGKMDTNIGIRTLIAEKDNLYCWGGGGIIADSDAHQEFEETLQKVKPMMALLERHFSVVEDLTLSPKQQLSAVNHRSEGSLAH